MFIKSFFKFWNFCRSKNFTLVLKIFNVYINFLFLKQNISKYTLGLPLNQCNLELKVNGYQILKILKIVFKKIKKI